MSNQQLIIYEENKCIAFIYYLDKIHFQKQYSFGSQFDKLFLALYNK